jgi:hypothetical protein
MKTAIMQPYFFPYLGYFQLIHAVDQFIFLDNVNYIKRGWIHRNRIMTKSGIIYFGASTSKSSQFQKINEVKIVADEKWRNKLLKTLRHAYGSAINFEAVNALVKDALETNTSYLSEICKKGIGNICKYLEINTNLIDSSQDYNTSDLRGQQRILKICKDSSASHYINPTGGRDLYDYDIFERQGIKLNFIQMKKIDYENQSLSIIDILMHCKKESIQSYLHEYTLS